MEEPSEGRLLVYKKEHVPLAGRKVGIKLMFMPSDCAVNPRRSALNEGKAGSGGRASGK